MSDCINLETLYLSGNMIEDVAPIANIPTLKYVDLNSNLITSIEHLKNVTFLEMLCIESNCILDFETIKDSATLITAYNEGAQGTYEEAHMLEKEVKDIVNTFTKDASDLEKEIMVYNYIKDNMYFDDSFGQTKAFGYHGIIEGDGVYYHCDALWDEDMPEWTHFNRSTGFIYNLPDHTHDLNRYPICETSMSVLDYYYGFMEE